MSDFPSAAASLGIHLSVAQATAFERYRDLLVAAAGMFNLTAVREAEAIERRHFLESLALGQLLTDIGLLKERSSHRVIDIGTGAGLPGLPIKIAWPSLHMSLLESNQKRCAFLRQVIGNLDLRNVEVLEGRAEAWGRSPAHRDGYDLVLARAVAPLPVLIEYALPFLKAGGALAAPKGSGAARETADANAAATELHGAVERSVDFEPPAGMRQTLIIVRKTGPTPDRFPRREGVASKRPLA